jgi:cytochrome c553
MVLWAVVSLPAAVAAEPPKLVREVCAACHGLDGNGGQPLIESYPRLAAKRPEYLKKQLRDYQSGKRQNLIMVPQAANLTPEQIDELAGYYATQPLKPGIVRNRALVDAGRKVYVDGNVDSGVPACAGCHLPDGTGDGRYPHLVAQHAEYVYGELKKFASGERSNDRGLVMQSVALRMTDAEMKAVAEYIAGMK